MYPYVLFWDLSLYEIFTLAGILAALVIFRVLADRADFPAVIQNLCLGCTLAALVGGYALAVLAQAFYNSLETGKFEITSETGMTFYGGLVGGAAVFLAVYFGVGHFLSREEPPKKYFWRLSGIAAPCIAAAHGLGRFGCLTAGCCHGKITEAWYGVPNVFLGARTVPIQLFEALFLLAVCAFLIYRVLKARRYNLAIYLMIYAVWRFFIEYFRADDRGETLVSFLSPSQLTAVLLLLVGVALIFLERKFSAKEPARETSETEAPGKGDRP